MDMAKDFNKPLSTRELQKATVATMDILKALVLKNQFGRICARAGWTIEMVFHDGDSLAVRERAWKVIDLFIEVVGSEKLAIWWGLAPVAMASEKGRERMEKHKPSTLNNPKGFAMMFDLASGKPKPPDDWVENAQDFRIIERTRDRKSTRLNSSHQIISYAVFCLKKKKNNPPLHLRP